MIYPARDERLGSYKSMLKNVFRCEICENVAPPRTKAVKLPIAVRSKDYPYRVHATRLVWFTDKGVRKVTMVDDPGGHGVEIAQEATVCPRCAAEIAMEETS